jgi:hypothetical protein
MQEKQLNQDGELFEDDPQSKESEDNHGQDCKPLEEIIKRVKLLYGFPLVQDNILIPGYSGINICG